jgi:multicomponent K+:H+ antiporter subunit G
MIVELLVASLLLGSGALVLTAAVGLWRLDDFFLRMHAPALANTLASWAVALASIVYITAAGGRLALHQWVIVVLLCVTVPVTTSLVARATLFRMRSDGLLQSPTTEANAAVRSPP